MFDHCLYFNTSALARQLEKEWAQAFAPFGLTPSQAFMLRAVLEHPGLLQRELADALAISRPTATRALDGLMEKGLIRRAGSDADGREQVILPTAASVAMREGLNEAGAQMTKKFHKLLGTDAFAETVSRIREVRSALK